MASLNDHAMTKTAARPSSFLALGLVLVALVLAACGSSDTSDTVSAAAEEAQAQPQEATTVPTTAPVTPEAEDDQAAPAEPAPTEDTSTGDTTADAAPSTAAVASSFTADVWADNWFALYVNGVLVGEDSVPITTERSFNKETITFEATYPLTIAIEAKDFKETDSGIEYIGAGNQQMGDGGIIAQITDQQTGEVVAVTNADWQAFVTHAAPLNTDCEKAADPDTACQFEITADPAGWIDPNFDDSGWAAATAWSEADVRPKDGYDQVSWSPAAQLIWGTDLEVDNTILLRTTVAAS